MFEGLARPQRDPGRVERAAERRLCVHLVDVLFARMYALHMYVSAPRFGSVRLDRRTWPPGPELREKVSSTACLGISFILKLSIQVRASALWAASWMTGIGGGMGRPSRPE